MSNRKDITEKLLFEKEDVFADILNVLLFDGEEIIQPQSLAPTGQRSQLKIANAIHEQERDVAKLWVEGNIRFALFGLENQTKKEKDMVMRTFSYDGTSYKEQVIHNRNEKLPKWKPYPAITIVLYFGMTPWNEPKTLMELLGDAIPEKFKPFVNDYRLHVFEIAFLSPETVAKFKSDFRIVADYFVQMRINKDYTPSQETITHVEEVLKLMSALTNDSRFEDTANEVLKEGGPTNMCDVLNKVESKGRAEGRAEGLAEGRLKLVFELVSDGILSITDAATKVGLTETEFSQKFTQYKTATAKA